MKKQILKSALMVVLGMGLFAGNAMADNYEDCDPKNPKCDSGKLFEVIYNNTDITISSQSAPVEQIFNLDTYVSTWDINAEDSILSATLYVYLTDDSFFDGSETAIITYDNGTWTGDEGDKSFNVLGEFGLNDHTLTVSVTAKYGDFKVEGFALNGCFLDNPVPSPVPEPAAMLLFGTGILGLAATGRRKINK